MDSTQEHENPYRILSYCYGYGGLDKGVERVIPTRTTAFVEIEAFQNFNLVAAMKAGMVDKAPIWTNLKTFDASPFRGKIHGIIGGYPCQGESLAGNRKLSKDPRFLWPYISETVRTVRPLFCFFENVGGHLTGSFPLVLESLQSLGYKVEAGLFTASEVGAPHKRERLFILAIDRNAEQSDLRELVAYTASGNGRYKQKRRETEISIANSCKEELVNPENQRKRGKHTEFSNEDGEICKRNQSAESKQSSETMADPSKSRLSKSGSAGIGKLPKKNYSGIYNRSKQRGSQLANASESRLQGKQQKSSSKGHAGLCNGTRQNQTQEFWPARPGQQQHEWEEPRTIKPGMGCTVNGYNFRTELLRQYGNGVVSQQAEKAFRELMNQIIKEL